MKVLVVDDSRAIRLILSQMLRALGCVVEEASHGREALQRLEAHKDTNLVMVDWNMPEMNGLQLLEALKNDDRFSELRRMMVTTESEMAYIAKAIEAGAHEYVMKPFTIAVIQDKLRVLGLVS